LFKGTYCLLYIMTNKRISAGSIWKRSVLELTHLLATLKAMPLGILTSNLSQNTSNWKILKNSVNLEPSSAPPYNKNV
jgi:hypothetical protein